MLLLYIIFPSNKNSLPVEQKYFSCTTFIAKIVLHESCCEDYIKVLYFITINYLAFLCYFFVHIMLVNIKLYGIGQILQKFCKFCFMGCYSSCANVLSRFITVSDKKKITEHHITQRILYRILQSWCNKIFVC